MTIVDEEGCYLSPTEQEDTQNRSTMVRYSLGADEDATNFWADHLRVQTMDSHTTFQRVFAKFIDDIVLDLGTIRFDNSLDNNLSSFGSPMTYDADFFSTASVG